MFVMKRANKLGLYDMNGNVWEWILDKYSSDYNSPRNSSSSGFDRVYRGGFNDTTSSCRSAIRLLAIDGVTA